MLRRKLLIVAGALALTVPTVAHAEPGKDRFDEAPGPTRISGSAKPAYLNSEAKVTVMVELTGDPVAVVEAQADQPLSEARAAQIRSGLKKAQDKVKSEINSRGGKVFSQMQSAYNGMRASLPRKQLRAVSQLPGVKAVQAAPVYTTGTATSVPFLGVPGVWQNSKYRGEGVKVAVIDSGIDYTHADFAGPGTVEAYKEAQASDTPNPAWFGPNAPRVKGGYDFVGDDFDANDPASTPKPDANPLDCGGHGSHVAGIAAGGGVNSDGTAFTGPYDAKTPKRSFVVGPGVAPKADLYALKVFGCEGSTTVTTEAIDWAVKNRMDVINMSLGAAYGTVADATAVAARNAQAAGVVVVTSAGNEGPNPYLAGSPGTGHGVVSVAAIDSTATYPGARLTFNGTTRAATHANDVPLVSGPLTIVNLTDDPGTDSVDESLGCAVSDYTRVGITKGGNQIAVTTRGECARVARAIFGEQAGARAVIMVNNVNSYPPYEGTILSNPDDDEPFTVTIPFLGVRSSDGAALRAAEGKPLTMAAGSPVPNAGFRKYVSFSSGGPRTGDSGVSPVISAPGLDIRSAGVGTGNGPKLLSGTSMAAPHVAGVAALARQAHKKWSAGQISAALVTTADPAGVSGYRLTLGGGLVDAKQVVSTSVFAIGDQHNTRAGKVYDGTLSFGFHEPSGSYRGTRTLTLVNKGSKKVTFRLKNARTSQSVPSSVSFSRTKVVVPARSSRTVNVTLTVRAKTVGSSLDSSDQFAFREASGNITITTNGKGTLRVPYLMVPRAQAKVWAAQTVVKSALTTTDTNAKPATAAPDIAPALRSANVKLTNPGGALRAGADFYTWGLQDQQDVNPVYPPGFDLRAAGVQSFEDDGEQFLVFAVNTWDRWSNAAAQEFDVLIDNDRDGKPDYLVFCTDSGYIRTGEQDGVTEVFVYDIAKKALSASGYLAQAPTDSSTVLLPVAAADLGITDESGAFDYTVASYSQLDDAGSDEFDDWARYDPWRPAISNGDFVNVPVNGSRTVPVTYDLSAVESQRPLGTMVVVLDNRSGKDEARLLPTPRF